ncbi:chorismate-binding protein [Galbibacter mesophilus]|uniref:chorismate-binding protein n=1 Tax=Galbibacter mesophilus TaxID=379069 RepID=UPI00191D59AE|nr:chorismate-binding protein [Galbibacter mesophilus]MCM5663548.1 isochorismate synthase [Galbibacter mesophilus]
MLASEVFFSKVSNHHENQLPFVMYRKPDGIEINGLLQSSDAVFYAENYTESGFVFTPFEALKKGVLIPEEDSEFISTSANVQSSFQSTSVTVKRESEKEIHIDLVCKAIEAIKESSLRKIVVSRKEIVETKDLDVLAVFKKLVASYPKAFCYLWFHPKVGLWMGATPETLLSIYGNRFKTMALAGTQRFLGSTEVLWGEKEKEEQQMVTDSILQNIESFVKNKSVSEVKSVKAGNLLHLKTDIEGELMDNNLHGLIKSLHPTPAVCGLPKQDAEKFILENEGYDRDFYTGFLGELNISKNNKPDTELFVNLRCMQYLAPSQLQLYVGGGITKDSVAALEWEETVNKTRTMLDVLLK